MLYDLVVITGAITLARWLMGIIEYLDAPVKH
jgi:hypothetical protein